MKKDDTALGSYARGFSSVPILDVMVGLSGFGRMRYCRGPYKDSCRFLAS